MQNKKRHYHQNNFELYLNKNDWTIIKLIFYFFLRISCDLNIEPFDINQSCSINLISSLSCNGKILTRKSRSRRIPTNQQNKKN